MGCVLVGGGCVRWYACVAARGGVAVGGSGRRLSGGYEAGGLCVCGREGVCGGMRVRWLVAVLLWLDLIMLE